MICAVFLVEVDDVLGHVCQRIVVGRHCVRLKEWPCVRERAWNQQNEQKEEEEEEEEEERNE